MPQVVRFSQVNLDLPSSHKGDLFEQSSLAAEMEVQAKVAEIKTLGDMGESGFLDTFEARRLKGIENFCVSCQPFGPTKSDPDPKITEARRKARARTMLCVDCKKAMES